jgi:hypothetical protein
LIADANGLSGTDELQVGASLKIPQAVASNANPADAYSVYNEGDIIGSTSPELTIKKKTSFLQS